MSTKNKETKFDIWWNSYRMRRITGVGYSLGASVVIIGAMFKILHLPFATEILGIAMSFEAIIFALGSLDKPYKEYDWDKIFHFEEGVMHQLASEDFKGVGSGSQESQPQQIQQVQQPVQPVAQQPVYSTTGGSAGFSINDLVTDEDIKNLSEGIGNLAKTAQQFTSLADAVNATDNFVKNIDAATQATGKFIENQESLTAATNSLTVSYQSVNNSVDELVSGTKNYEQRIEDINRNLASINTIYELQLKSIQNQTEGLSLHTEKVSRINHQMDAIMFEAEKMKAANMFATIELEKYKEGTVRLTKQITDLNQIYGNMLNALN